MGLPELVTETEQDYEVLILELATNPTKLAEIKEKLGMPEDRDPVMMIGIGKGIKGQLRMVSQDNNYKYPVFHKQPIPVEFK